MATWRNGYAEDCKSLYPGSIPGVASKKNLVLVLKKSKLSFLHSSVAQLVEQLTSLTQLGHQPKTERHLAKERSGSSRNPREINGKTEETKQRGMHQKRLTTQRKHHSFHKTNKDLLKTNI